MSVSSLCRSLGSGRLPGVTKDSTRGDIARARLMARTVSCRGVLHNVVEHGSVERTKTLRPASNMSHIVVKPPSVGGLYRWIELLSSRGFDVCTKLSLGVLTHETVSLW